MPGDTALVPKKRLPDEVSITPHPRSFSPELRVIVPMGAPVANPAVEISTFTT
jgi:hypothetical protein